MHITITQLRQNIYRLLDQVVETGIPLEITRHGKQVKIILEESSSKLSRLKKHDIIAGNSENLTDISWENEWQSKHI